jgi:hypothetical protein
MNETYEVDIAGNWRLYTTLIPATCAVFGTVRRLDEPGDIGALLRLRSGIYVQSNAGALRSLDQGAVRRAVARAEESEKAGLPGIGAAQ